MTKFTGKSGRSQSRKTSIGGSPRGDRTIMEQERIAVRAYEIWLEQGCPQGREKDHWYQAESELKQPVG
jgi:hypothetical protein